MNPVSKIYGFGITRGWMMREFSVLIELYLYYYVSMKCDLWVTFTISQTKQEEKKSSGVAEKIDVDTSEKPKDKKGVSGVFNH